ncbi:hypothetical protein NHL50_05355 [Acidimicrobiia bacterium EGI L10123]|uniref:hypothetical protein n=1 Tax=Salinilacustrithrix flava TaxID=2957203 RepID=UPI003D7C2EF1|nr:hypothetical protein [Acidimicrobiia bacterium EGI L10123]
MASTHSLGRLTFAIDGDHPGAGQLRAEFPRQATTTPDIGFRFVDRLPGLDNPRTTDFGEASQVAYRVGAGRITYQVTRRTNRWDVAIVATPGRSIPPLVQRLRNFNYLSRDELIAKSVIYGPMDHLAHIAGLDRGQSLAHASSVARDGRGVALFAEGGVGKTSTALKLVLEHGWSLLGDDLAVLADDGTIHAHPKRMQIYAYNLAGDPVLRHRLLSSRSPIDRLHFEYHARRYGPKSSRRRVSAEQLLGPGRTANQATLALAVLLRRIDSGDLRAHELDREHVVEEITRVILHEIDPYRPVLAGLEALGITTILPSESALATRTSAVIRSALAQARVLEVSVPPSTVPAQVVGILQSHLDSALS